MDYAKIVESIPRTPQVIDAINQRLSLAVAKHKNALGVLEHGDKRDMNKIIWMVEVVPVIHAYTELLRAYGEPVPEIEF